MIRPECFYNWLADNGVTFYSGVPDSLLKDFCAYVTDHTEAQQHIIAANEGVAIALAAGHHIATAGLPTVYMQNSGIGNAVNPLLSLADEMVYSMPMLLIIGWRGEPGIHDEPQHKKQGLVTLPLLEAMEIPYTVLSADEEEAKAQVDEISQRAKAASKPCAIVIKKGTFDKYSLKSVKPTDGTLSREDALKIIADAIPADAVVVSTTGKLSRELYELRESSGQGHERDFLTVGSMGHASSIAAAIALSKPDRQIYCFDGDGAFLMHTGALSNIGALDLENFHHIVFNNGAHESVGAQPTLGFNVDMPAIATACGYKSAATVSGQSDIIAAIKKMGNGPDFLEIRVKIASRDDLGRPKSSPTDNKNALMEFLNSKQHI